MTILQIVQQQDGYVVSFKTVSFFYLWPWFLPRRSTLKKLLHVMYIGIVKMIFNSMSAAPFNNTLGLYNFYHDFEDFYTTVKQLAHKG